jgi:EmrB/QacA subfamily drug resistance transporter
MGLKSAPREEVPRPFRPAFGLAWVDSTRHGRFLGFCEDACYEPSPAPDCPPAGVSKAVPGPLSMRPDRIVPLIIAVALFMENMDSTVIATSLPAIAADIGTNPLALKLAVTSYLFSLAVFIPASGWTADRFGARTVFRAAIGVFMLGSIGCAMSSSLTDFVIARIVQGMGGAMMTPVGRMVLVRSIAKRDLVNAMAWVTVPALIGPVIGPPVGGFITTYATWHWIFLINLPIGVAGILLATRFITDLRAEKHEPFDVTGMVLAGLGIAGVAFGFSVLGLNFLPWWVVAGLIGGGAVFIAAYLVHARRVAFPALDLTLFKIPTFRASVTGGFVFRVGIGALPFLLPLLLQVGFGMTPFQSGLITFASAVGAMTMKMAAARLLRRFGFRSILLANAVISAGFLAACAGFTAQTPAAVMFLLLVIGGFFRSLQFTSINTLAYADVEPHRVSRATALVSVAQQLALSTGVALGALAVEITVHLRGEGVLSARDFPPGFLVVAAISALSVLVFMRLAPDAGAELANRPVRGRGA